LATAEVAFYGYPCHSDFDRFSVKKHFADRSKKNCRNTESHLLFLTRHDSSNGYAHENEPAGLFFGKRYQQIISMEIFRAALKPV
jgi:hypothetical protein